MSTNAHNDYLVGLYAGSAVTLVGEIIAVNPPELQYNMTEVTNLKTSSDGFPEYIFNGRKSIPVITADVNFVKTEFTGLQTQADSGSLISWQVKFNDSGSSVFSFAGLITSLKPKQSTKSSPGNLAYTISIQPSGSVVMA
jgi:hypothetical protein